MEWVTPARVSFTHIATSVFFQKGNFRYFFYLWVLMVTAWRRLKIPQIITNFYVSTFFQREVMIFFFHQLFLIMIYEYCHQTRKNWKNFRVVPFLFKINGFWNNGAKFRKYLLPVVR